MKTWPGPLPQRATRTPVQQRADRRLAHRMLGAAVLCIVLAVLVVWLWS